MASKTSRASRRKTATTPARTRRRSADAQPSRAPDAVAQALAIFAHEVRTPLTGIRAISDLLATSDLGERERLWIDTIKASADHLSALATLFVDAARSRGGRLTPRQDFFDLKALVRAAAGSLAGRAAAKGLDVETKVAANLPGFVTGDPVRLRAALENLIDNAVKFTEHGSVSLRVGAARRPGGRCAVSFAVSDSGIGLTLAEIKRLFRPFSQASAGIAARFGGAGLGLSSVRRAARAMGGDITVTRRRGGTTFTLSVLLTPAEKPAPKIQTRDGSAPISPGRALRILSVEDNPFGRVVLNAILGELGHVVEFVGHGEAALTRINEGDFDAVLMDMVLPDISGVEVIRRIRSMSGPKRRVAIIGVSGRGEDEAAARRAGADAFLLKPASPRALAVALTQTAQVPAVRSS